MFFKRKNKPQIKEEKTCGNGKCNSCEVNVPQTDSKSIIKHIVAIGSGKGGVGKSSVTTNLAFALKEQGFKVGILDADIYGPSQAMMLGHKNEKVSMFDGMIRPIVKNGIKSISMAHINNSNAPTVWRAPMAISALEQFCHGVYWQELDYLLIDLPPGTGDIQLSICQQLQVSGAIIVSTPQKIASQVAKTSLKMFKDLNIPILGIVENMSYTNCSKCNHQNTFYLQNDLETVAKDERTQILCKIPMDAQIMQACDEGKSVVSTNSLSAKSFLTLAEKISKHLGEIETFNKIDSYRMSHDGNLELLWSDGVYTNHNIVDLRNQCSCSLCTEKESEYLSGESSLEISKIIPVGQYGMGLHFSDGHKSGIYAIKDFRG